MGLQLLGQVLVPLGWGNRGVRVLKRRGGEVQDEDKADSGEEVVILSVYTYDLCIMLLKKGTDRN